MTSEDLGGYKPGVVENVKLEYYPLGESLNKKAERKTDKRSKVVNTKKQDKNLIYNSQHIFEKFKDISDFKELSLDSKHKKLNDFHKKFTRLLHKQRKTKV